MRIKDVTIKNQLILGFASILVLVLLLGTVAYSQTTKLYQQTATMYENPLQVRRALSQLSVDLLNIQHGMYMLTRSQSETEKQVALQLIGTANKDGENQFAIIKEKYLGPKEDVEQAYAQYGLWEIVREENINLILSGEIEKAEASRGPEGKEGLIVKSILENVEKVDIFSFNKAESLYTTSMAEKNKLHNQLVLLTITILLLVLLITYMFLRNIRTPLKEMNKAVLRFDGGDMSTRILYQSKNELGILAHSINLMADSIVGTIKMRDKATSFIETMLKEEAAREFFKSTLGSLAMQTNAQMAAVYLLGENKKAFIHFESVGMNEHAKKTFILNSMEGEFGQAVFQRKPQIITNIPSDTTFLFNTVNGKFVPREIITIPIINRSEIIGIISLATINQFSPKAMEFIDSINFTMNARIQGILSAQRVKDILEELEKQNTELTDSKTELSAQSRELIQQNTELEIQKKQLGEASRLKTNFLSNMSHELRTPLNSVIALSGVLNRRLIGQIPEEEYSYLEIIERNGKNLLLLINDILDISRIEAGHEEIEMTKFSVHNLIHEVVSMIKPQSDEKEIGLLFADNEEDFHVVSDVDKCRHILQNLIGNAVKFTEKGAVTILTKKEGDLFQIKIIDTGIGISNESLGHIFDEFRQADGSTSRKFGGTGLGLAIAKKYAALLGGDIQVASIFGQGSEFTLSLPIKNRGERRVSDERTGGIREIKTNGISADEKERGKNKRILIVDDNESAIIQLQDFVQEMGYKPMIAKDATEAFEMIEIVVPDAMILDLMMPDIDGFKVLETLRNAEATAHIPVLILTAKHITKEELQFLVRNNVHQLIQKGDVDRNKLESAIANMLFIKKAKDNLEKVEPKQRLTQGKPLVLVVEDNPDNMITVKAILAEEFKVIEAIDGGEAIQMARENHPDLILMDIALPGINGIEAFYEIRKIPELSNTLIIALTASAMEKDRESILAHGFDAFIPKPIIVQEFNRIIGEVLYGR